MPRSMPRSAMHESLGIPTGDQQLLLRAALADGATAVRAWQAWRARTDVDTLDGDSQWLLPRLFWNLHRLGVPADQTTRYRHVYRHHWYRNQLMLRQVEATVSGPWPGDTPGIVVGGAATALRERHAIGVRPFERVEVSVSVGTCRADDTPASPIRVRPAVFGPYVDTQVVQRAVTVEWRNRSWRLLHPSDQFVDICVRRHVWDRRSSLLWIADAVSLIRAERSVDWTAVDALARSIGRRHQVADALATLAAIDDGWARTAESHLSPAGPPAGGVS